MAGRRGRERTSDMYLGKELELRRQRPVCIYVNEEISPLGPRLRFTQLADHEVHEK